MFVVDVRSPAFAPQTRGCRLAWPVEAESPEEAAYLVACMLDHEDALALARWTLRVPPERDGIPNVYRPFFTPHVCPVTGERDGHWDVRQIYPMTTTLEARR